MRTRLITFVSAILISVLAAAVPAAELAAQKNSAGGVTVTVTPQNPAAGGKSWDFKVAFDTHSQDLKDDVVKSAVLVVDGASHAPTGWQGDPPGGHHRAGTLTFNAISPQPNAIELQIQRPGESTPRSFRWQLK